MEGTVSDMLGMERAFITVAPFSEDLLVQSVSQKIIITFLALL